MARESWKVTNVTSKLLLIADLQTVPPIGPGQTIDLLQYSSYSKIEQSDNLSVLLKNAWLVLTKQKKVLIPTIDRVETSDMTNYVTSSIASSIADATMLNSGGVATIAHSDGTFTVFRPESDSNAARGESLISAQTSAVSGETINVNAGTYTITQSLGKDGVNWCFSTGAIVNSSTVSIWSDGGEDISYKVSGHGIFNTTSIVNCKDNIGRFDGNSTIYLEFDSGSSLKRGFATYNGGVVHIKWSDTITSVDGTFDTIFGTYILHGYKAIGEGIILELDGGAIYAYIDIIESTGEVPVTIASGGNIYVYNALIISDGEASALNGGREEDVLRLSNCILDTSYALPLEGNIQVSNVSRSNGSNLLGNNVEYLDTGIRKFTDSFVNADLTAGVISFNHALQYQYCIVQVYNNNDSLIVPDSIVLTDSNNSSIDLSTQGELTGTWNVVIMS